MLQNRIISKVIALVFLSILIHKTGGGLYLHNWLHEPAAKHAPRAGAITLNEEFQNCTCIDEFAVPFAETPAFNLPTTSPGKQEFLTTSLSIPPFLFRQFIAQRGPPQIIA